jgi:hypothetical protein
MRAEIERSDSSPRVRSARSVMLRIGYAGACRDGGCGHYVLLAAKAPEYERSEISGGGAGRRSERYARNATIRTPLAETLPCVEMT